jgi:hypothetical protein
MVQLVRYRKAEEKQVYFITIDKFEDLAKIKHHVAFPVQ